MRVRVVDLMGEPAISARNITLRSRGRRSAASAIGVLGVAALAYWWPILIDPAGRIAGGNGDPLLVAYIVSWVSEHLFTETMWNPPFFHPATNVLAYSDHMLGLGLLAWPAVVLHVPPALIVNVITFLGIVLTSVTLFWWLVEGRHDAMSSASAALTVGYGAWRVQQLSHPQIVFTPLLPIALLCYARFTERSPQQRPFQRGGPIALGDGILWLGTAALAFQTLCTPALAVSILPLVLVWVCLAAAMARRRDLRYWAAIAASFGTIAAVNLPIARHYWALGEELARNPTEVQRFSAGWADWISAPPRHWLYGSMLTLTRGSERELFPGVGFIAVLGIGLAFATRRRARWRRFAPSLVVAGLAFWLATGPSRSGVFSLWHAPYDLFQAFVPGGRQVRVPARFVTVAGIFLAPVIAVGWRRVFLVLRRLFHRRGPATAALLLLLAVVLTEGLPSRAIYEPLADPRVSGIDDKAVSGGILFLPLAAPGGPGPEIQRMWAARRAGRPIVNGYSGHVSLFYEMLRQLQQDTLSPETRRALYSRLLHHDVDTIIVEAPSSVLIDQGVLREIAPGVYRIPSSVHPPGIAAFPLGTGLGLLVAESGWSYTEHDDRESWTWSISPRASLMLPMDGSPRRTIALRLRSLYPGEAANVELRWNGRSLGTRALSVTTSVVAFPLPEAATREGWSRFELWGPKPIQPAGGDARRLSVCLYWIAFE